MPTHDPEMITRIDISAAGGGRFIVEFEGKTILATARDPEHEACRELLGCGIRGRLESYIGGKHSMTFDIERAAGRSVSDGASSPLRITNWRPFEERGSAVAVSQRAVESGTGKLAEAAVCSQVSQIAAVGVTVHRETAVET